jgi:hypothetical protein
MSYRLCKSCGAPLLKKGQKRKHPDAYRHAYGCPEDKDPEDATTIKMRRLFGERPRRGVR